MWGAVVASIVVTGLAAYVIGVFVYDRRRRKKGAPSIFLDVCEEEGHGKRLIRDYRKKYGDKKTNNLQ